MNTKKTQMVTLSVVLAVASLLAVGGKPSFAAGSTPTGTLASVKARQNNAVSAGSPLSQQAKGALTFGADGAATLVLDPLGNAPTTGGLAALDIGSTVAGAVPSCYLLVYDSSVAADTTETGSVSRMLVPAYVATTSGNNSRELEFPRLFHTGLVVLVGGPGAASCRASIAWLKNGGTL